MPEFSHIPMVSIEASSSKADMPICPLLALPRELRDIIYSYALYQPAGLFYYRDEVYKSKFCSSKNSSVEFNQLKYTCRQLREETLGLELKLHNDLTFCLDHERKGFYVEKLPANQFLGFLDMCHEAWRRRIRRVFLLGHKLSPDNVVPGILDVHNIVRLCQNYSHFLVFWEHPYTWSYRANLDPSSFLSEGLMFLMALRTGKAANSALRRGYDLCIIMALGTVAIHRRFWRPELSHPTWGTIPPLEAPNFRVLPYGGPFDEEKFRKDLDEYVKISGPIRFAKVGKALSMEAIKEGWVSMARDWFENGL